MSQGELWEEKRAGKKIESTIERDRKCITQEERLIIIYREFLSRILLHVSTARGRVSLARQLTCDGINMVQEVIRSNGRFLLERLESCGETKHIKQQRQSFSL